MRLNLGCGKDIRDGWINADIDESVDPDVVLDLEETPWPWGDRSASEIVMDNVLEHLDPRRRVDVLEECHRVLKRRGFLRVTLPVPERGSGWDVTHYAVPSWRWVYHPRWDGVFEPWRLEGSPVGPGRLVPTFWLREALTRYGVVRCLDEVTTTCYKR